MTHLRWLIATFLFLFIANAAIADDDERRKGLKKKARKELIATGLTQYVGNFDPVEEPRFVLVLVRIGRRSRRVPRLVLANTFRARV